MDQLTPTVSALPGYGTPALPWVNQIPQSLDAPYAIKMEPHQDSCDGMASTQGWSQVVVQAGFKWSKSFTALVSFVNPRLKALGWSTNGPSQSSNPSNQDWTKTLTDGTSADGSITRQGVSTSPVWELVTTGQAIGKRASGC